MDPAKTIVAIEFNAWVSYAPTLPAGHPDAGLFIDDVSPTQIVRHDL